MESLKLRDFVQRCARTWPDKTAFISGDTKRTWRQMDRRSDRLASALQELGVSKGDVVASLGHEHLEKPEILFACLKIGAVRTGINWRYTTKNMLHIIRDSDARVVFAQGNCVESLSEHLPSLREENRTLVGFGGEHDLPHDYDELLDRAEPTPDYPRLDNDDLCMIIYTSGTTGKPKGAQLTQEAFRESMIQGVLGAGLNHGDSWLNITPHAGVTCVYSMFGLMNGMTTILPDGDFDPEEFLDLIEEHSVTTTALVVTALRRVIQVQEKQPRDLSSVRLLAYGSESATPAVLRSAKQVFQCRLHQYYGMTEIAAPWASILWNDDHKRGLDENSDLLNACGKPNPFVDMAVLDENGEPVEPGTRGEIAINTQTVMTGYRNLPEVTEEKLQDGWYLTGDLGYYDEAGYYYLVDRKDFLIMSGAMKVYPSPVENVLDEHPDVREVAVVGAPHPDWGEAVVAVVRTRTDSDLTSDELRSFARGDLADYELPKHVQFVDKLPRGVTGKINRVELKQTFREQPALLPWET